MILYSDPAYGYKEGIAMTQTQAFPLFKKFSLYDETPPWVHRYNSSTTDTKPDLSKMKLKPMDPKLKDLKAMNEFNSGSMETAKDIIDRHIASTDSFMVAFEKAAAEIAGKAWEAGVEHGFDPERYYSTEEAKAAFMKSLFPLKEI